MRRHTAFALALLALMACDRPAAEPPVPAPITMTGPLIAASNGLVETLGTYLELGHSLEATARELFVHANTVRYRLKRVCDVTGWDPLLPREAFVLQTALVVGRLSTPPKASPERHGSRNGN